MGGFVFPIPIEKTTLQTYLSIEDNQAGWHYDQNMNSTFANTGYEIRVRDHLDQHWHTWFEGWTITNLDDGTFLLKNTTVDQSGLHGSLNKIRDLNLTLISVAQISVES